MPRMTSLYVYTTKGMRGFPSENLTVNKETGIVGDRNFAYARRPQPAIESPHVWASKANFYVGMNTPGMVALLDSSDRQAIQRLLGLSEPPEEILTHGNFNMTDTQGPTVSLLNLATYRLFEEFLHQEGHLPKDQPLNPERFRMNVQIDDWEPFAELDLADSFPGSREIMLGNTRFVVDDACERCKATHANPDTGQYDLKTVPLLMQFMEKYRSAYKSPHRGVKSVMGVILVPLDSGYLHRNDPLKLI